MKPAYKGTLVSYLPSAVRQLHYTRNDEPEQQVFDGAPEWMFPEPPDLEAIDLPETINLCMIGLKNREWLLLKMRYWDDCTLLECAIALNVTVARARQIERNSFRRMRRGWRNDFLMLYLDENYLERISQWRKRESIESFCAYVWEKVQQVENEKLQLSLARGVDDV